MRAFRRYIALGGVDCDGPLVGSRPCESFASRYSRLSREIGRKVLPMLMAAAAVVVVVAGGGVRHLIFLRLRAAGQQMSDRGIVTWALRSAKTRITEW